ncbi:MAG: murein biosynthesis integral membrane protein MurJ [Polyangiaceae bacterium]
MCAAVPDSSPPASAPEQVSTEAPRAAPESRGAAREHAAGAGPARGAAISGGGAPKKPSVARGAALVSAGILASRLVGLVRTKVTAHYLGTTGVADAVAAAFRVGNITQNLLGEGTLSATFIPVYAKLRKDSDGKASRFARATLGMMIPIVGFATLLFTLGAPLLAGVIANGFHGSKLDLTIQITRTVFPMTGVLVLGAWALGVLNAHRRFLLPYMAPVIWSVAQIAALVAGSTIFHLTGAGLAIALGWGALAGGLLQVIVMLPTARRLLGGIVPIFSSRVEGVREAASRAPSAILGRGIIQLSGLIDMMLASRLGEGANAVMNYTQQIYLLPMSLLGAGEAAAALPELAEQRLTGSPEEAKAAMRRSLGRSLARLTALSFVATAVFGALGSELITVLLQGGKFDRSSTHDVAIALGAYALGLPGNAICRLLTTVCFALGDTKRPALYAIVRVAVSTAVSVSLMGWLGVPGIVIGAGVAAWVELGMLAILVRREIGGLGLEVVPIGRILIVAASTASTGLGVRYALPEAFTHTIPGALVVLVAAFGVFVAAARSLGVLSLRSMLKG